MRLCDAVILALATSLLSCDAQVVLHSMHRCEGDAPVLRTCAMTNVCYDGTQFMYYASDSHDIPAKPLLNIGVYASSPTLDFKLSERDLEISDAEWVDVPSFLMFRSHPKHYFHTLLDDFLGLYRTMFFYTHGSPSPDNQILLMDDFRPVDEDDHFKVFRAACMPHLPRIVRPTSSPCEQEIRQVFSRRQPQRLSYIFTTLASSHGLLCFRNLAAGPGQHQLAGPGIKTVPPTRASTPHGRKTRPSCERESAHARIHKRVHVRPRARTHDNRVLRRLDGFSPARLDAVLCRSLPRSCGTSETT